MARSMSDLLSRILVRAASREDIPALVRISNSSVAEDEDSGFGAPRSDSLFAGAPWLAGSRSRAKRRTNGPNGSDRAFEKSGCAKTSENASALNLRRTWSEEEA